MKLKDVKNPLVEKPKTIPGRPVRDEMKKSVIRWICDVCKPADCSSGKNPDVCIASTDKKPNWKRYRITYENIEDAAEAHAASEASAAYGQYEAECRDQAEYEAQEERDEELYYNSEGE